MGISGPYLSVVLEEPRPRRVVDHLAQRRLHTTQVDERRSHIQNNTTQVDERQSHFRLMVKTLSMIDNTLERQ